MSKKLYAITSVVNDEYRILGLCSSKKAVNNIVERLITSDYVDDVCVKEYDDLFFLRDNTYKSYEVEFQTVSDGYKEFTGGTAKEVNFYDTLCPTYLNDSEGRPSKVYAFGHDRNEAVRNALKMLENCPKARLTSIIS